MSRTLADMTPGERQACVGMWCDNLGGTSGIPRPVVLACVQGESCWVLHADLRGERSHVLLDRVAPRFDLPRAWTPDGKPVPMSVEMGEGWDDETNSPAHWPVPTADCCDCERPDMRPTHHRFVTEWEEA